mgnify:CR=1 FL=1
MKAQIVWKVVYKSGNGSLWSCVVWRAATVQYRVGRWVSAPPWLAAGGYHLLAFKTRAAARVFTKQECCMVYKAKATEVSEVLPPMSWLSAVIGGWLHKSGGHWPEQSVMCKKIKLLCRAR